MKATIDGINVEGTPDEVWSFLQRSRAQGTNLKPYQPMPDWHGPWWSIFPPSTLAPKLTGTGDYVPAMKDIVCTNTTWK